MRSEVVSCFLQIVTYVSAFTPLSPKSRQMSTFFQSRILVDGIKDIVLQDKYDTFLLDMWGVMHDGSKPYDGVLETVQKLKDAGKEMIILSNSSKRQGNSNKMLTKLGFNPHDFAQVITSGEVSFNTSIFKSKVGSIDP
jgi:FMN phosphatase YigB (HAD superfamily)